MNPEDLQKLLGGYATGTLTAEEQQALFEAALQDQNLFDALAREQSLRDLLRDPAARAHLLAALDTPAAPWYRRWLRPLPMAAVAALAVAAVIVVRQLAPTPPPVTVARLAPPPAPPPTAIEAPTPLPAAPPSAPVFARARPTGSSGLTENRDRKGSGAFHAAVQPSFSAIPAASPAPSMARGGMGGGGGGRAGLGGAAPLTAAAPVPAAPVSVDTLAAITGSVKDPAGAAIPNAQITAREVASGSVHTATTNTDGQFTLPAVPAGQYEVKIASAGFQPASRQLSVNERDHALLNTTLNVGAATETVEVTAAASALKAEEMKSTFRDTQSTAALPLAQRSALPLSAPFQYSVLRQVPGGSFVDAGSEADVAAGTPLKLRVVPNDTGSLRIRENTPDGGWRDLTTQRVERGKPFETAPLAYRAAGRKQFQVSLTPDSVAANAMFPQQQSQSAGSQQKGKQAAQAMDASPALTVTITVNIR